MDDRLTKALEQSRYAETVSISRKNLKLRYETETLHSHNGGTFRVTRELINFCSVMVSRNQDDIVLIDDRENPIMIRDLATFLKEIEDIYFRASNRYFVEFEKLRRARTPKAVVTP